MDAFHSILKKYWDYDNFRPLQYDIIESICSGKDTLGLMPTGGGKSITFQVPAMYLEGVCLVITPLIALMKDQVENLKRRNIKAACIYTGMRNEDISIILDNTIYDAYKFLYVSPERLSSTPFIEKIKLAKIALIAVDEAHCISQWGYDFRPSYLKIGEIRDFFPGVPVLALTATATPDVIDDIQDHLHFSKKNVFRKSFYRENLAYIVKHTERKEEMLLRILNKVPGTSVVYVRNRKKTKEVCDFLLQNNIPAAHYHAGLRNEQKDITQDQWKNNEIRVIVATNAFGMGIDKPDVRTVIHLDLPDTIEAYYQEAGRAGRDDKKAYAIILFNKTDVTKLNKRISDGFPPKDFIINVYNKLCSYLQIGIGSGLERFFPFSLGEFCASFKLPVLSTFNGLKILEQAGYIYLSDEQESNSTILFTIGKDQLYKLHNSTKEEAIIHTLLRSYTGLFSDPAFINEELIASRLDWTRDEVYQHLTQLNKEGVIKYIPRKKTPFISFLQERIDSKHLTLSKEVYEIRKERYIRKVNSILEYSQQNQVCRSQLLLNYFGDKNNIPCNYCDVCISNKTRENNHDIDRYKDQILKALTNIPMSIEELIETLQIPEDQCISSLRYLIDNGLVFQNKNLEYISNASN